ncbi:MAG TPA: hypothetical protein VGJ20_01085 [Xanthobacteraceae bacterium]
MTRSAMPCRTCTAAVVWLLAAFLCAGRVPEAVAQTGQPQALLGQAATTQAPGVATPITPPAAAAPQGRQTSPAGAGAAAVSPAPANPAAAAVQSSSLPPQPQPAAPDNPGFLHALTLWWQQGVADFNSKMKKAQQQANATNEEAMKNAAEATKNAAGALLRFPSTHVIEISQPCPTAGNGAPDCQTTAANVCRDKGFTTGQPLDIRTAEKCTASLWISGKPPESASCPVETVLLRVACQ